MGFLDSLRTYAGSWSVTEKSKLAAGEIKLVDSVEVISSDYGLSMCFMMKAGGRKYVPLSKDCELSEGDIVDPKSIEILTLERDGDEPIYRAEGEAK